MPRRFVPPPFPVVFANFIGFLLAIPPIVLAPNNIPRPFPIWVLEFLTVILIYINLHGPLLERLFPGFRPLRNTGKDLYSYMKLNPWLFWYATGETVESFEEIVRTIGLQVSSPRSTYRPPRTDRRRRCLLDVNNRILLAIMWLKVYPTYRVLASLFAISKTTAYEDIYHIIPILFVSYRHFVTWPNIVRWRNFLNTWPDFPTVVGCIDGTVHRIQRPTGGRLQREFYRRDKKFHFMSSQVIIDANGMIVLVVSGFPGHLNDAQTYQNIPSVGANGVLRLPRRARLAADGGYAARDPLLRPLRIARNRIERRANRRLRRIRVSVEHAIDRFYRHAINTAQKNKLETVQWKKPRK